MKLYRVALKVRPSTAHPLYWQIQFGYLLVWLLDDSPQVAGERAAAILESLPYERIGARVSVVAADNLPKQPEFERCAHAAKEVGVAFFFVASATGADEAEFEQAELP
jgi:hypothetical protein